MTAWLQAMNRFLRQCSCIGIATLLLSGPGCDRLPTDASEKPVAEASPLNAAYILDGEEISLVEGRADVEAAPGSASMRITRVWGEPEQADLSGDGQKDALLILTHSGGGSGTFYYAVAAIREAHGFRGTVGVLLGDRITPRSITIAGHRATIDYLGRAEGEAFAVTPAVPRQRIVIYDGDSGQLIGVEEDFEGEADPARMTLQMKTWVWLRTLYNDDSIHTPDQPEAFTLTFTNDERVQVTTDCNNMQGGYEVTDNRITFAQMISTRMFCEGSQEQLFAGMLENVSSYFFDSRGQLILEIKYDSGSMIFR